MIVVRAARRVHDIFLFGDLARLRLVVQAVSVTAILHVIFNLTERSLWIFERAHLLGLVQMVKLVHVLEAARQRVGPLIVKVSVDSGTDKTFLVVLFAIVGCHTVTWLFFRQLRLAVRSRRQTVLIANLLLTNRWMQTGPLLVVESQHAYFSFQESIAFTLTENYCVRDLA